MIRRHQTARRPAAMLMVAASFAAAFLLAAPAASPIAGSVAAAGSAFYVDGKTGSDANTGTSWASAFKTISRAARAVPHGDAAGYQIVVRGYTDYVYRERPVPGGFDRWGGPSDPLVFEAEGWQPGGTGYVRPIVSGGERAPMPGHGWRQTGAPAVWYTRWTAAPRGFNPSDPYSGALFQDGTKFLWQHASLADLRRTAPTGRGGYWFDAGRNRLYVAARKAVNPRTVSIEVPTNNGFYFSGAHGARYIHVRGFHIRHAAMGIAFTDGVDHSQALDNVLEANSHLGIHVQGGLTGSSYDAAVGNRLLRNRGSFNTVQAFKVNSGSHDTVVCGNEASHNGMQGIKVAGPHVGAADPRRTRRTDVCDNDLHHQNVARPGTKFDNGSGITISDGALDTSVHHNRIRGNHIGIHVAQRTAAGLPMDGTRIKRNLIWNNERYGVDLRDGDERQAAGTGSLLSQRNLYWGNGIGIFVAQGSINKTFDHDTVFGNRAEGIRVGCGCSSWSSRITVRSSLVTHNGGYGIRLIDGHVATVSHTGLGKNADGAVMGPVTKKAVNGKAPGYRSRDPGSKLFLYIHPTSYQYTAGPDGTPIGARW